MIFVAINMPGYDNQLKADTMLHYLVREPKIKSLKPPVIFLLHGVASNEKDLFSFADQLPGKYLVVSVRAPYILGPESYAWYHVGFATGKPVANGQGEEKSRNEILAFMGQFERVHPYDENEVYLVGFSQGAIMSFAVGLTRPDKVRGIAVMSGRILDDVKPLVASPDKLKHLQVFMTHGTNDKVLDIGYARASKAYLNTVGIKPTYKEYPEGHTISREMVVDLIGWLSRD
jgi:phospholipase/carboxylesterase